MTTSSAIETTCVTIYEPDFDEETGNYKDKKTTDVFEFTHSNKHKNPTMRCDCVGFTLGPRAHTNLRIRWNQHISGKKHKAWLSQYAETKEKEEKHEKELNELKIRNGILEQRYQADQRRIEMLESKLKKVMTIAQFD